MEPSPIDSSLFKGYDVRGIYGENLDESAVRSIGLGFGSSLPLNSTIFVGADPRIHSPPLLKAFLEGLTKSGVNAIDAGMVPTPLLTYLLATRKSSGAEITASHNPPKYNGVKMYYSGLDLSAVQMQELYQRISTSNFRIPPIPGVLTSTSFNAEYIDYIGKRLTPARKLKVVVDTGNGACGLVAGPAYERMGSDVTKLFWEPDGNFPNHPADPHKEETLTWIKQKVLDEKADLGIALDGDGDRVAFIDETGRKIRSDDAVLLFAKQALKESPGSKIVYDLRMTSAFVPVVTRAGGTPVMCACGRTNVSKSMRENDAAIGGEQTGHTFFRDLFYHDDGIFAGAKMIDLLSKSELPLSALVDQLPHYPCTPELRIVVGSDRKTGVVQNALVHFSSEAANLGAKVSTLDGVRLDFPDGSWGLLRVSNTEPSVTMRFEGPNQTSLEKVYSYFKEYLAKNQVALPETIPK